MSNLAKRLITSGVALPVILAVLIFAPGKGMLLLVLGSIGVGCYEVALVAMPKAEPWRRAAMAALGLLAASAVYTMSIRPLVGLSLLALLVMASIASHLGSPRGFETALREASLSLLVALWIGGLLAFLALVTARPDGSRWGALLFGCAFVGDSAAYFIGRAWGRTRLAPIVSPNKTWEGAIAGLAGTMAFVAVAKVTFLPALSFGDPILLGLPAAVLCQTGDLAESMLKRAFGAKDASGLMPGHGGLLDRLDSLLFLSPLIYLFTYIR